MPTPAPSPVILDKFPIILGNKIAEAKSLVALETIHAPSWNTAGRPQKPKKGTYGFNFQTQALEFWNGSAWLKLAMKRIT